MAGIRMICKMYGGMIVKEKDGTTVEYKWDYAKDEPRIKSEMTKKEIAASEKAKWGIIKKEINKYDKRGET